MNVSFVNHSSKSCHKVQKSSFSVVRPLSAANALYILANLACNGGIDLAVAASAEANKQLKSFSTFLGADLTLCCCKLYNYTHPDAFTWALQFIKTIIMKANNEELLGMSAALISQMVEAGKEDQIPQLKRFQAMICTKGAAHRTSVESVLVAQLKRLPLSLTIRGTSLKVMLSSSRQTSAQFAEVCAQLRGESDDIEFRDLLHAAHFVIKKYRSENDTPARDCISDIVVGMKDLLLCTSSMEPDWGKLICTVVSVCEEEWVYQQLDAASPVATAAVASAALLQMHLITTLLEKQHCTRTFKVPEKVVTYLDFLFSKLFLHRALHECSDYFAYIDPAEAETGLESVLIVCNDVCEFAKGIITRFLSHLSSAKLLMNTVSICTNALASSAARNVSREGVQGIQGTSQLPSAIVLKALRALLQPYPILHLFSSRSSVSPSPDMLYVGVTLAHCLSCALQKDLRLLDGACLNQRVGLAQCAASLEVIISFHDWVQVDPHAALSLVLDTVHQLLRWYCSGEGGFECAEGVTDKAELKVSSYLMIGVLSQFSMDVAAHFRVSGTALLSSCTAAAPLQFHTACASRDISEVDTGMTLSERVGFDVQSFLRSAMFAMSLCSARESFQVAELEQWFTDMLTKNPTGALLLLNDFTFLGPVLSRYSDLVVTERVAACFQILSKRSSAFSVDNMYLLEAFSSLPAFLTMSRHSLPQSDPQLELNTPNALVEATTCSFDIVEQLEEQVFKEENVARLVGGGADSAGGTTLTETNFFLRLQVLNRVATMPEPVGRRDHLRQAARSFLTQYSDLFHALVGNASMSMQPSAHVYSPAQHVVRCELFITSQERSLSARPPREAGQLSMPVVSAAKLEFLLSQHCTEMKSTCEKRETPALPWFNLNDFTFCMLHALRTTVRPVPCAASDEYSELSALALETDHAVLALVHAHAQFISLPVLVIVLREALLSIVDLPVSELNAARMQHAVEPSSTVLLKYVCVALSLLASPSFPARQCAQVLCGAFTVELLTKLWRRLVFDTDTVCDALMATMDRVVALLVSKLPMPGTVKIQSVAAEVATPQQEGSEFEVLTLCASVLSLCDEMASLGLQRHCHYESPLSSICHRLRTNCAQMFSSITLSPLLVAEQRRLEYLYRQPVPLVGCRTEYGQNLLVHAPSAQFMLTRSVYPRTDGCTEIRLNISHKASMSEDGDSSFRTQFCLADFLLVLLSCRKDGVRDRTPVLSDAQFESLIVVRAIAPAERSSAGEGWLPEDFTLVQLLEESLRTEYGGNYRAFVATVLNSLLAHTSFPSLVRCGDESSQKRWKPCPARPFVILLQILRSKSAIISQFPSCANDTGSLLELLARALDSASNLNTADHMCSIGEIKRLADVDFDKLRAASEARLRQVIRWSLATVRFLDPSCVVHDASQRLKAAQSGNSPDTLLQCAVNELQTLISLYAHCAQAKESVPAHVRTLVILVFGVITTALLQTPDIESLLTDKDLVNIKTELDNAVATKGRGSKKTKKVPVEQQLRTNFHSILHHLLVTTQPGQPELLVQGQGVYLKHSLDHSAEVCYLIKKVIESDADLRLLHAQVIHHNEAIQKRTSPGPSHVAPASAPVNLLTKRPTSAQNLSDDISASESAANLAAVKKKRKLRPTADEFTPVVSAPTPLHPDVDTAPQVVRHTDKKIETESLLPSRPAQEDSVIDGHINDNIITSFADAPSAAAQSSASFSSASKIRTNNSFFNAIMEVTAASPLQSVEADQTGGFHAPLTSPRTTQLHSNGALDFTPTNSKETTSAGVTVEKSLAGDVFIKTESATKSNAGKPVVVTHVSKKFGGGF